MGRKTERLVFGAVADQILNSWSEVNGQWPGAEKPEFMLEFIPIFWDDSNPYDISTRFKIVIEGMKSDLIEGGLINVVRTVAEDEDDQKVKWNNYFISYVPEIFLQGSFSMPTFLVFTLLGDLLNLDHDLASVRFNELLKEYADSIALKEIEVPDRSELERSFRSNAPPYEARYPDLLFLDNKDFL